MEEIKALTVLSQDDKIQLKEHIYHRLTQLADKAVDNLGIAMDMAENSRDLRAAAMAIFDLLEIKSVAVPPKQQEAVKTVPFSGEFLAEFVGSFADLVGAKVSKETLIQNIEDAEVIIEQKYNPPPVELKHKEEDEKLDIPDDVFSAWSK